MVPLSLVLQKEPRKKDLLGVFVGTFFNLEARLHTVAGQEGELCCHLPWGRLVQRHLNDFPTKWNLQLGAYPGRPRGGKY